MRKQIFTHSGFVIDKQNEKKIKKSSGYRTFLPYGSRGHDWMWFIKGWYRNKNERLK